MSPSPEKHLIKKYANRKLYDTRTSKYVSLEDIAELLRQGKEIQAVDSRTGRDITSIVLGQLVVTEEKRGMTGPVEMVQEKTQQLLDFAMRTVNAPAEIVAGQVERRRQDFEVRVEDAIEQALRKLRMPTRSEMVKVERKLAEISKRLDRLEGRKKPGKV